MHQEVTAVKGEVLYGDISTGYRWNPEKHSDGVFLGDSAPAEESYPIKPTEWRSMLGGLELAFDPDYIPLTCAERRARYALLCQLRQCRDPFVRAELKKQEQRELPLIAALEMIFGKGMADWRLMLLLESRHDARAQKELGRWMKSAAIDENPQDLERFTHAKKEIARVDKVGPRKRVKTLALLFAFGFQARGEPLPTHPEVFVFLEANGVAVTEEFKRNAKRDIFNGPILGSCPTGKPGRPRVGSEKWLRRKPPH